MRKLTSINQSIAYFCFGLCRFTQTLYVLLLCACVLRQVKRSSIGFAGSTGNNLVNEARSVPFIDQTSSSGAISPSSRAKVKVHFIAEDPVCGEVTITARVEPSVLVQDSTVLTFKSRVPTLALANRATAIEYVSKMIDRFSVIKTKTDYTLDLIPFK